MNFRHRSIAALFAAAAACTASVVSADVVIGDWENGASDGWIDWGTMLDIAAPKYEWTSFGATRGTSAIKVNASGYNQNLSLKLQNVNLSAAFFQNKELAIDFSFPENTEAGYAQVFSVAINAEGYGFHDETPIPKFTYGFPNGGPQTTTVKWDYHRLVDGIASNGEISPTAQWVEFIIATNSDATHGTLYFDNARLTPKLDLGDFNADGFVNATDVDLLLRTPNDDFSDLMFDVNADGAVVSPPGAGVAASDTDYWVNLIVGTRYGDANLDKKVDFDDLLSLAQNYGNTTTGTWALGDFDGNNTVAFEDLLALAQNYGFAGVVPGASGEFMVDWTLAQSMVPEPVSASALMIGFAAARRNRR
jgi:hypothetical protein